MQNIIEQVRDKILEVKTSADLDKIRLEYLGKSGFFAQTLSQMASIAPSERKEFGGQVNSTKQEVEHQIQSKLLELENLAFEQKLQQEKLDVSLPGRIKEVGKIHPISKATAELISIFTKLGFEVASGPSIESDWYNFSALNIAHNHPARQMHDTFYMQNGDKLLRTHTSPVQIRKMENQQPPFRFISFGRTYRSDSDATHTPMFHQMEAVYLDKGVHMGHLKSLLRQVIERFFENTQVQMRMRPSFFPFTEPSAEIDIKMPGSSKWLEVLGSGMIHPNVLQNVGINQQLYSGFALGLGIERFAMLKYGIDDLRDFFSINLDWMRHYGFSSFRQTSSERF
jgi:phenylalanyl-tRNA synthetase alpha chain